jgi:Spy/CpxP family protein refolding chaperone
MKHTLLFLAVLFGLQSAIAQGPPPGVPGPGGRKEELEALRIAFISKQLELTPAEAEKFWPVYNSYQGDLRKMVRENQEKKGDELALQERILNLRKQYKPEFTRSISDEKFDKLMRVERSWSEMLRKELQRRHEAGERPMNYGRQRPPGGGSSIRQ